MDMCNLIKRMLPLSQPSGDGMKADIARQKLIIKEHKDIDMKADIVAFAKTIRPGNRGVPEVLE